MTPYHPVPQLHLPSYFRTLSPFVWAIAITGLFPVLLNPLSTSMGKMCKEQRKCCSSTLVWHLISEAGSNLPFYTILLLYIYFSMKYSFEVSHPWIWSRCNYTWNIAPSCKTGFRLPQPPPKLIQPRKITCILLWLTTVFLKRALFILFLEVCLSCLCIDLKRTVVYKSLTAEILSLSLVPSIRDYK